MTTSSEFEPMCWTAWKEEGTDVTDTCMGFVRLLRLCGVAVATDQVIRWLAALGLLGPAHPADLYWSGRVTLIRRAEDLDTYDRLFCHYWCRVSPRVYVPRALSGRRDPGVLHGESPDRGGEEAGDIRLPEALPASPVRGVTILAHGTASWLRRWLSWQVPVVAQEASAPLAGLARGPYSDVEVLRHRDLGRLSAAEIAQVSSVFRRRFLWLRPSRLSRRLAPAHRGSHPDIRRMLASAARTGGDPVRLLRRDRTRQRRRWVFLGDVSGSMSAYALPLLHFIRAVVAYRPGTEVFLFGTRLSRVTGQIQRVNPAGLAGLLPPDAGTGTRLGAALALFNRRYGSRGMAHGAVVVVFSDGLDQGEPETVRQEMAVLRRLAHRIFWVNPLKQSPLYRPEARAMAAALPYVDELLSGHSVAALEDLLCRLTRLG